ncbi:hypothetical protein GCM10009557_41040 [Virgisporangium ochraceum]|uniref:PilZ domain-containing protein n=1 Tax=Virgisporangium ochraceum TaxID=65505 RepID=A0A8J3ZW58_9ACTN|nr:hypothetical protein [Virgisporangium ochraceum]GIJ70072.1 hypothetical protein Voc01_049890 [Virgisporangium ochraceum]
MNLPAINTRVDVLLPNGVTYPSRIEDVADGVLQIAAPMGPRGTLSAREGDALELAWLQHNERVAAPARLTEKASDRPRYWGVQLIGGVQRNTRRGFVRGGGGEKIRVQRTDEPAAPVNGYVMDIGEVSLRARFLECDYRRSHQVEMAITLSDGVVRMAGQVLDVRYVFETEHFDVIVTYEPTEVDRRAIRSYVYRRMVEQRRRLR